MKTSQTIGICLIYIVFIAMPILAQDSPERKITFEVPVELHYLHETVESIIIDAHVTAPGAPTYVAEGRIEIPAPPDGNLTQKIIIEAHEKEGYDITTGTRYHVQLFVKLDDGRELIPGRCTEESAIDHPGTCCKDDIYYNTNASGDIPQE